jgi:hypothetical protein
MADGGVKEANWSVDYPAFYPITSTHQWLFDQPI